MPAEGALPRPRYRPDIDGLRALAIVPVVFYHFRVPGFGGGFVGVDIFFVISGYLITELLTDAGRPIGLASFYARRIRRLAPALFAMVAAVTVAVFALVPPNGFIAYGKSLIALPIGGANVFFWRAIATYFAPAAESHPLLHTWSLAVEEQFYLLFPIGLGLVGRFGRRAQFWALLIAGLASLAAAAVLTPRAPSASFYLAPTRAWELLLGACVALRPAGWTPPAKIAGWVAPVGILLIGYAVVTFTELSQTPGPAALIPCVGAALLILCGEAAPGGLASRLLASRLLVGIGLISYALYLWHWPINVLMRRYWLLDAPTPVMTAAAIGLAIALATASFFLIERPTRRGALMAKPWRAYGFAAVGAAAMIGLGAWMAQSDGAPERFPDLMKVKMQPGEGAAIWDIRRAGRAKFDDHSDWLVPPSPGRAGRVMIWGDSFANHLVSGFDALKDGYGFAVWRQTRHGCPPVLEFAPRGGGDCPAENRLALTVIAEQNIDLVLIAARWEGYTRTGKLPLAKVKSTIAAVRAAGARVVIVGEPPNYAFDFPDEHHFRRLANGADPDEGFAANTLPPGYNAWLAGQLGEPVFDPTPLFCRGQLCQYRDRGLYLVSDYGHLTRAGSQRMVAGLLASPLFQVERPR